MCIIINLLWDFAEIILRVGSAACAAEDFWEELMVSFCCLWVNMRDIFMHMYNIKFFSLEQEWNRMVLNRLFGPCCVALGLAERTETLASEVELGRENAPLILNAIKSASRKEIKRAPYLADSKVSLGEALLLWLLRFRGHYSQRGLTGGKGTMFMLSWHFGKLCFRPWFVFISH